MADAAVIFDVDGVLLELTRAEEDAFFVPFEKRYGLKDISRDWNSYAVRNDENIISEILARPGLSDHEAGLSNGVHFIGFSVNPARLKDLQRAGTIHTSNNHLDSFRLIGHRLQQ